MIEKKRIRIFLIIILAIPILCLIGFGTWIITNKIILKPDIEVDKVLTEYLNSKEGTYNGNVLLPSNEVIGLVTDGRNSELTYYYKEKDLDNDYIECVDNNKSIGPINAGEYLIKVTYKVNETTYESDELSFTINKATYDLSNITMSDTSKVYNREKQGIEIQGNLPENVSVTYEGLGIDVGEYKITAKFSGDSRNYESINDMTATLTITPKDISECRVYFKNIDITTDTGDLIFLNGTDFNTIQDGLTVSDNNNSLKLNDDYLVNWGNYNLSAGSENNTIITGKGNYTGTNQISFKIEALKLIIEEINESQSPIQQLTYNGIVQYPKFRILDQYNNIISLDNCTITYKDLNNSIIEPINVDIYTINVTVEYKESSISSQIKLQITPANLNETNISLSSDDLSKTYSASAIRPTPIINFTCADNSIYTLINNMDFRCTYDNNINVGLATINISGINNFTGNSSINFTITKGTLKIEKAPVLKSFVGSYQAEIDNSNQPIIKGVDGSTISGTWKYDTTLINESSSSSSWQTTVEMTFIPADSLISNNYNALKYNCTTTIEAVCHINSTYYSRIEYALSSNSSGTIYCEVGKNPYIRENCTIQANVTLTIPYEGTSYSYREGSEKTFADQDATNVKKNLKNTIYVNPNITITNNGTLNIGGVVGCAGQGIQAQTSGSYTQIILSKNATISNNKDIYCLGYIKESYKNNNSKVNGIKGNIYFPMVLYDFRGGSITTDAYKHSFPINQFDFPNIQSLLIINYGCTLTGYTDIYINLTEKHFPSNPTLISSSNAIFILNQNSRVELKYNGAKFNTNESFTNSSYNANYKNTQLIDIYGSGSIGSCSLTISMGLIERTVDTKNYFLPISSRLNIKIHKNGDNTCNFELPNKVAFLTGSNLQIDEGINVNIKSGSALLICTNYLDPMSQQTYPYPTQAQANFIMNGNLINNGSFGGIIKTTVEQATMNMSSSTNLFISNSDFKGLTSNLNASAYLYGHKGQVGNLNKSLYRSTTYGSSYAWYSDFISINYNSNGGIGEYTPQNRECSLEGYTIGNNPNDFPSNNPTREHYRFQGWYLDEQCTDGNEANGSIVYYSPTLYAKWNPIDYLIQYDYRKYYNGESASEAEITDNDYTKNFNIESTNLSLPTPTYKKNDNYEIFDGWYFDSDYITKIGSFNGEEAIKYLNNNSIQLYGRWYEYGTEIYNIKYVNTNNDLECKDKDTLVSSNTATFKLPDLSTYNNDKEYDMYFDGWYSDEQCTDGNKIVGGSNIHGDVTLYAKWIKKNKFNIIFNNETANGIESITLATYYLNANTSFIIPNVEDSLDNIPQGKKLFWTLSLDNKKYTSGNTINIPNEWNQTINLVGTFELLKVKITITPNDNNRYSYSIIILDNQNNSSKTITTTTTLEIGYGSTFVISITPGLKHNLGIAKIYYSVTVTCNNKTVISKYNDAEPKSTNAEEITEDITIVINAS